MQSFSYSLFYHNSAHDMRKATFLFIIFSSPKIPIFHSPIFLHQKLLDRWLVGSDVTEVHNCLIENQSLSYLTDCLYYVRHFFPKLFHSWKCKMKFCIHTQYAFRLTLFFGQVMDTNHSSDNPEQNEWVGVSVIRLSSTPVGTPNNRCGQGSCLLFQMGECIGNCSFESHPVQIYE